MLLGEYRHAMDSKGRVAVPAKFRVKLASGAILTRGLDHCLFLFSAKEWDVLAVKLTGLPVAQANSRAFVRLMFAGAMDVELDQQGRILIPDYLRRYASLGQQVVVAGLYNRVEIWDIAHWDEYRTATERSSQDIAEQLGALGI
jgi:MraZ protein